MSTGSGTRLTILMGGGRLKSLLSKTTFELRGTPYMDRPWCPVREGGIDLFQLASTLPNID
jgi:hypothetical protein